MPLILTVCTGNICRSPIAAHLLQGYLGEGVTVASAGTHAVVGASIDPPMLRAAGLGGSAPHHEAVQLDAARIEAADLVIGMAAEHRTAVVRLAPSALRKAVTLDELAVGARLLGATADGTAASAGIGGIGDAIAGVRHLIAREGIVDIPDPYRRSAQTYERAFAMIDERCLAIAAWLMGDLGDGAGAPGHSPE